MNLFKDKKILFIVGVVVVALFFFHSSPLKETKKQAITDIFTRSVQFPVPSELYCGETATVKVSGTLTNTNGLNDEFVILQERDPTGSGWGFTLGNFLDEGNIISKVQYDLSAGLKTYTYTLTSPAGGGTYNFETSNLDQFSVGEGPNQGAFADIGGTESISCVVCTVSTCAAGNNFCCDSVDNNCDSSHLKDETVEFSVPQSCPLTQGVCAGSLKSCSGGAWSTCTAANYGANYQLSETTCDGLDNDCDGSVNEGMVHTGSPNTLQAGVCAGSLKSCTSATTAFFDDYSGITGYVATETANTVPAQCTDGLDNDCDGIVDEPKKSTSDRDCSGSILPTELNDAINNVYGDVSLFSLGTFTSNTIGSEITKYYGAA